MPGWTYLAEAVYSENRIVVLYAEDAPVILAAYDDCGLELDSNAVEQLGEALGCRVAQRVSYASFADLVADAQALTAKHEGFVIRFEDGLRLKVKGEEYRHIHAIISRCAPLAMWEAMAEGDDHGAIRRELPEEFLPDFDKIVGLLSQRLESLTGAISEAVAERAHLSDRDLGLSLSTVPQEVAPFLFP